MLVTGLLRLCGSAYAFTVLETDFHANDPWKNRGSVYSRGERLFDRKLWALVPDSSDYDGFLGDDLLQTGSLRILRWESRKFEGSSSRRSIYKVTFLNWLLLWIDLLV